MRNLIDTYLDEMLAEEEGRNAVLIELNPAYVEMAKKRTAQGGLFCGSVMIEARR